MQYVIISKKELIDKLAKSKNNIYFSISADKENWLYISKIKFKESNYLYLCSNNDGSYRLIEVDVNNLVEKIFSDFVVKNTFIYTNFDVNSF